MKNKNNMNRNLSSLPRVRHLKDSIENLNALSMNSIPKNNSSYQRKGKKKIPIDKKSTRKKNFRNNALIQARNQDKYCDNGTVARLKKYPGLNLQEIKKYDKGSLNLKRRLPPINEDHLKLFNDLVNEKSTSYGEKKSVSNIMDILYDPNEVSFRNKDLFFVQSK